MSALDVEVKRTEDGLATTIAYQGVLTDALDEHPARRLAGAKARDLDPPGGAARARNLELLFEFYPPDAAAMAAAITGTSAMGGLRETLTLTNFCGNTTSFLRNSLIGAPEAERISSTMRAVKNFPASGLTPPSRIVRALDRDN